MLYRVNEENDIIEQININIYVKLIKDHFRRIAVFKKVRLLSIVLSLIGVLFLSACNTSKQQPVYEGMTISRSNLSLTSGNSNSSKIRLLSSETKGEIIEDEQPLDEDVEDLVTIEILTDDEVKYYVNPGETFIVQVHISNPNEYEIQSFTLNGTKYANYMFKDGSTLELLLLEVTAPATSGYIEYTIDAIKYIDGTEIKDVKMDGDQSIKAGIQHQNEPSLTDISLTTNTTSVQLTFTLNDTDEITDGNEVKIYLSDGEKIISEQNLQIGSNIITFDNLLMGKTYEYGIVAVYDLVDGRDLQAHWLTTSTFNTAKAYTFTNYESTQTSISFDWIKQGSFGTFKYFNLIEPTTDEVIRKIEDTSVREISDLLSNHEYIVEGVFEYTVNSEVEIDSVKLLISTEAKTAPVIAITNPSVTKTSVGFDIDVTDPDSIYTLTKVELFKGATLVSSLSDLNDRLFSGLLSNNDYTIKVSYTYDLNDGVGSQTLAINETVTTVAKATPTVSIDNVVPTQESIGFGITVTDVDQVGAISAIELYKGETLVEVLTDLALREFTGLLSNNEYTIKVTYTYDLNDGVGEQTEVITLDTTTVAKTVPTVEVTDFLPYVSGIRFTINIDDQDNLLANHLIQLFKGSELIEESSDIGKNIFSNVEGNIEYSIVISYTYNLNDGNGVISKHHTYSVLTFLYDGLGTEDNPFQIYDSKDLENIIEYPNSYYVLMNNINLIGIEWIPLGTIQNPFTGVFDGQGHGISGLTITEAYDYAGLFGYNLGSLNNFSLTDVSIEITGTIGQEIYLGSIVGYNEGVLDNIHALDGNVSLITLGNKEYLGGLVGYNGAPVVFENLSNNLTVSGTGIGYVGGIVGYSNSTSLTFINTYNNGAISGMDYVGGIVGYYLYSYDSSYSALSIINSYNKGTINGSEYVGGIVGYSGSDFSVSYLLTLENSYNTGEINGIKYVGGLLGSYSASSNLSITDSYNTGLISGNDYVGGLIGFYSSSFAPLTIMNSYNTGEIIGHNYIGGLIGYYFSSSSKSLTITDSHNAGQISGNSNVGGLVGYYMLMNSESESLTISESFNIGTINGSSNIGGLVGSSNYIMTIINSYNNGMINGSSNIGGLVGFSTSNYFLTIMKTYNSGEIYGSNSIGGLVGYANKINIYYSLNFGDVTVTDSTSIAGAIVGMIPATFSTIQSYYIGAVTIDGLLVDGVQIGIKVTDFSFFTIEFITNTILWDDTIWDFTSIDIENGVYPTLIYHTEE